MKFELNLWSEKLKREGCTIKKVRYLFSLVEASKLIRIKLKWLQEWRRMVKKLRTEAVCGFWIRNLISQWMRRLGGSELCTGKR